MTGPAGSATREAIEIAAPTWTRVSGVTARK